MPRRLVVAAALAVLAAGLGVRTVTDGAFAKYAGIALYAAFVYTLVVLISPAVRPTVAAVVALAFCWAVELAQLTPVPARLSERNVLARLALGSTFNIPDLFWYAVGVALATTPHLFLRRRGVGWAPRPERPPRNRLTRS